MAGSDRKTVIEQGGMGGFGGPSGGSGNLSARKRGVGVASQAGIKSAKKGTSEADEMIKLERELAAKRAVESSKADPATSAARKSGVTKNKDGVKTTEYPYVGKPKQAESKGLSKYDPDFPDGFKKGGSVRRVDGCAKRGKTRGRMV